MKYLVVFLVSETRKRTKHFTILLCYFILSMLKVAHTMLKVAHTMLKVACMLLFFSSVLGEF